MNVNVVVLVGRLTKDPELKYTPSGDPVASFTLAVNRPWKNAAGGYDADFINIVAWRKTAEIVSQYLTKGMLAGVEGRLQVRTYDKNDGTRVWVTEIVANSVQLGAKPKNGNGDSARTAEDDAGKDQDVPF